MGTIAISALDIGSVIIGGLILKFSERLHPAPAPQTACPNDGKCCTVDEKAVLKAKIAAARIQLDQLEAAVDADA
jgi:hypothetical protein